MKPTRFEWLNWSFCLGWAVAWMIATIAFVIFVADHEPISTISSQIEDVSDPTPSPTPEMVDHESGPIIDIEFADPSEDGRYEDDRRYSVHYAIRSTVRLVIMSPEFETITIPFDKQITIKIEEEKKPSLKKEKES